MDINPYSGSYFNNLVTSQSGSTPAWNVNNIWQANNQNYSEDSSYYNFSSNSQQQEQPQIGFSEELLKAIAGTDFKFNDKVPNGSKDLYNSLALYSLINKDPRLLQMYIDSLQSSETENAKDEAKNSHIDGYDYKKGLLLAKSAQEYIKKHGSSIGHCAKGVNNVLNSLGIDISRGDAWQQADKLAHNDNFKEVEVAAENLDKLPPGAIVVWNKTNKSPYGHISIATGNGKEISDHKQNQIKSLRGDDTCRVFIPV
ncbi:MAG: CHAP domain-containing protein [bacterium]